MEKKFPPSQCFLYEKAKCAWCCSDFQIYVRKTGREPKKKDFFSATLVTVQTFEKYLQLCKNALVLLVGIGTSLHCRLMLVIKALGCKAHSRVLASSTSRLAYECMDKKEDSFRPLLFFPFIIIVIIMMIIIIAIIIIITVNHESHKSGRLAVYNLLNARPVSSLFYYRYSLRSLVLILSSIFSFRP